MKYKKIIVDVYSNINKSTGVTPTILKKENAEIILPVFEDITATYISNNPSLDKLYKNKTVTGGINAIPEPLKATNLYKFFKYDCGIDFPLSFSNSQAYLNIYLVNKKNKKGFWLSFSRVRYDKTGDVLLYNNMCAVLFNDNININTVYSYNATWCAVSNTSATFTDFITKLFLSIDKNDNLFTLTYGRLLDAETIYLNTYTYRVFLTQNNYNKKYNTCNYIFYDNVIDFTRYPTSSDNDGEGFIDNSSDIIDFPELPTIPINVFTNTYKMTLEHLTAFKNELYDDSVMSIIKKWYDKTLDCIVSLSIVPMELTEFTAEQHIKVGTHSMNSNGILITNSFYEIDCGHIDIKEYYGNYIDYEQTIIQCYLPFVGFIPLKTVDVMGSRLTLKYIVNLITGCFNAYINVQRNRFDVELNSCIYETTGNMFTQIPVTSPDFSRIIQSTINTIVSGATTIATGGASYLIGSQLMQGTQNILNSSPTIQRSGNFDKNASICTIKKPFVLIERPRISIPKNFESKKGFLANFESKLTDLKGYTEVSYINIENVDIPKNCIDELKNILTSGVIL